MGSKAESATKRGRFQVWVSNNPDCTDGRLDGRTFPTVVAAEAHAHEKMRAELLNCVEIQEVGRASPPVRRWDREKRIWEAQDVATVVNVRVLPIRFSQRVAGELRTRLEGKLECELKVARPGVLVVTPVAAEEATVIVRDAILGVLQTFGLDALEEGLDRVKISIG